MAARDCVEGKADIDIVKQIGEAVIGHRDQKGSEKKLFLFAEEAEQHCDDEGELKQG